MRLKDRVAIITGAGNGMGRADALLFAKEGVRVVVNDIKQEDLDSVVKDIDQAKGEAFGYKADVSKLDEVDAMVEETINRFGRVDILVSNAGWDQLRPFLHTDKAFWDKIFNLNLIAHLNCVKAVLPNMIKNKYGKIVTIGSDAGRLGNPMEAPYSAAKGGVIAFTKTIAREFGRSNITANCVCPGITEGTRLSKEMIDAIPEKEKAIKMMETVRKVTPMGRLAQPEDVAKAVLFFASDDSSFVTGQVLSTSGGLTTPWAGYFMRPFEKLKVIDFSQRLPGPYCSSILSDLGAEVIMVERAGRPPETRSIFPGLFELVNKNKKSITLNMKKEEGRGIAEKLIKGADVLLEEFRPGVAERLGIGYGHVKEINPRMIYCSISGFGQDGPYRDRVGHDINYLSLSGILSIPGQPDTPPSRPGVPMVETLEMEEDLF